MMAAISGGGGCGEIVTLPHDAMIHEERTPDTKMAIRRDSIPEDATLI